VLPFDVGVVKLGEMPREGLDNLGNRYRAL
jgi:hypothetical protein